MPAASSKAATRLSDRRLHATLSRYLEQSQDPDADEVSAYYESFGERFRSAGLSRSDIVTTFEDARRTARTRGSNLTAREFLRGR